MSLARSAILSFSLSIFLFLAFFLSTTCGLNLHTPTTPTTSLPSQYTTIGTYPTKSQFYNFTVVHSGQVKDNKFNAAESSAGVIQNHLVVFVGDVPQSAARLAVDAEQNGAVALIFKQMDHIRGGRAVAFKTPVHIPIVVVSASVLETLTLGAVPGSTIELTAITPEEKSLIHRMQSEISALIILIIIIYAGLTPFFLYLFVFEVMYVYKVKQRYFSHNCLMKLVALCNAILWLLWIAIDPMGFKLKPHWNERVACYLAGGFLLALYSLILRILVLILSSSHFSSWHKTFISRLLYCSAIFFIVLFLLFGTVWHSPATNAAYQFIMCISVLVVGISFAIVGKLMIDTLTGTGRRNHRANMIIVRLTGFIAYYGVASVVLLGIVHGLFGNSVYTTFVCSLLHSFGLVVTFVLLFLRFPSQMQKSRRPKFSEEGKSPSERNLQANNESGTESTNSHSRTTEGLSNFDSASSSSAPQSSHFDSQLDLKKSTHEIELESKT
eukprot:Phypoly_transcript_07636.p1 GENE.Phypoly_transcript_07636~~Phypoly_transcript_07636.p1  ORF type:complete len:497 (+),score=50.56 Phypoly_transcript_07636:32-1522(+)